ncbi:MAG: T9SS C-terminal target domain-containing protein [Bacteroidetes bacterium]|nr:MAG: T9SS C-terminal target domain-containing protein [Bacteroidota bacterium]
MKPYSFLLATLGLFFSLNITAQWQHIGSGFEDPTEFYSIWAVDEDVIWALPLNSAENGEFFYTKTINGGDSWYPGALPASVNGYFGFKIFALDENTAWVIMGNSSDPVLMKLFKTIDGGANWQEQSGEFNEPYAGFHSLHFFNENEGIGFGGSITSGIYIFRTSDGGDSWVKVNEENLPEPLANEQVHIYSGNNSFEVMGDTLWFVTSKFRIFRTTDKGITWEAFSNPGGVQVYPSGLSSIAFEDNQNGIVVTFSTINAWETNDGGETWSGILLPDIYIVNGTSIEHIPGTENTYIVTCGWFQNRSISYTTDGGISWFTTPFEVAISFPVFSCVQFLSPTLGFGGAKPNSEADSGGIYKWTGNWLDSTSVTSLEDLLIDDLSIYPNPTSGEFYVTGQNLDKYTIVEIYNIKGLQLKSIDASMAMNGGLSINLSGLSSGVYFIKFTDKSGNISMKKITKY